MATNRLTQDEGIFYYITDPDRMEDSSAALAGRGADDPDGIIAVLIGQVAESDSPSTLLGLQQQIQDENRGFRSIVGDWDGDGRDTLGINDADGDTDAADFVV